MRKILLSGIVGVGLLTGCGLKIPTQMNITANGQPEFLMGRITPVNAIGVTGMTQIRFEVENLRKTCWGQSLNGERNLMSNGLSEDQFKHKFTFKCSDEATGNVILLLNNKLGTGFTGIGYGEMDNGSTIKISVGQAKLPLEW